MGQCVRALAIGTLSFGLALVALPPASVWADEDQVLVQGSPHLTQRMVNALAGFYEWALEGRLTKTQHDSFQNELIKVWQRTDDGSRREVAFYIELLKADIVARGSSEAERQRMRRQLQELLLRVYREGTEMSRLVRALAATGRSSPETGEARREPATPGQQPATAQAALLGTWQCQRGLRGTASLIFHTASHLVYDGEATEYTLVPGAMRVQGPSGPIDYPYSLQGNNLAIGFPDGSRIQCVKASAEAEPRAGGGNESHLRGMLCHWSGSSTSSSSFSRSTRVNFDGRGIFSYGTESSFSGESGLAYSGPGAGNRGTYRVVGNTVHLKFSDGSSGVAQVQMRQADGRITELMFEGQLYAAGLCD